MINHWTVYFSPKIRSFVHLVRQREYLMWKTIFDHRWGLIFPIAKIIDNEVDDIALISILSLSIWSLSTLLDKIFFFKWIWSLLSFSMIFSLDLFRRIFIKDSTNKKNFLLHVFHCFVESVQLVKIISLFLDLRHISASIDQRWTIGEIHLPKDHSSLHKTPNNSTIHRKDFLQWSDWGGEYYQQCDRIVKTAKKNVLERFLRKNTSRSSHFAWNIKRKSFSNWLDEKDSLPVTLHHPQSKFPLSSFSFSPQTFRLINTEKRKDPLFFVLVSPKVKTLNNVNGVLLSSSDLWRCLVLAMKRFPPEHFDTKRIVRHWKRTEQETREDKFFSSLKVLPSIGSDDPQLRHRWRFLLSF